MSACPASGVLPNTMRAWRDGVIVGKESGQLVVHTARDGVPFLLHGHLSSLKSHLCESGCQGRAILCWPTAHSLVVRHVSDSP